MSQEGSNVQFLDPGRLVDGDLELVLLRAVPGDPARGRVAEYKFEMRRTGTPIRLGEISLRLTLTEQLKEYGGHVGYGVDIAHRGHRYAARSVQLLLPLCVRHGINLVLITCDPQNIASRRTIERAGGQLQDIIEVEIAPGQWRRTCRYHISLPAEDG